MLDLLDIIRRAPPTAWVDGDNIPWNDPEFSARMLLAHLDQSHDRASRRTSKIEAQVSWMHHQLLNARSSRILDLTCGPGFHTNRLTQLGHRCVGVDFSPASIAHARAHAPADADHPTTYIESDVRDVEIEGTFDMVSMLWGQLNVFQRGQARTLLGRCREWLVPGGSLLLELQTDDDIEAGGRATKTWRTSESGVFHTEPHLILEEHGWDEEAAATTTRFYVVDSSTGGVERFALTMLAYSESVVRQTLEEEGFVDVEIHPGMGELVEPGTFVVLARRPRV